MRNSLKLFLICLALLLGSCRDPMEHSRCDDTEVKRVASPDGKLVIVIYNRSCSDVPRYTYAEIEDPTIRFSWPGHAELCTLVSLDGGYHQMDAVWLDNQHIEVSSTDELENDHHTYTQQNTCNEISVAYKFRIKPPPAEEADEQTAAVIREAIKQSESCISEKLGQRHPVYLRSLVENKRHRNALELLCTNLWVEKCPISKETYALLEQAGTKMGIPNSYLDNLKPLVK